MDLNNYSQTGPQPGAIVIGGSMAGLLAGRVLASRFSQVTVIERDHFPSEPGPRRGVPQARHVHALLTRGLLLLEELFPGIGDELVANGAVPLDWSNDVAWYISQGWGKRFDSGIKGLSCSRDLLEWHVRSRLAETQSIHFLQGTEAVSLLTDENHQQVTGIRVRSRDLSGPAAESDLPATLVVDASGRSSRTPQWLQEMGYPAPGETVVNAFLGYSSRWYQMPAGFNDWKILLVRNQAPNNSRGGVISQVDGSRWVVTLSGLAGDIPPTDELAFLEFMRRLPSPRLYELLKNAQPLTPVYGYQRTENRWRHYEQLARMPENLVVLGDAACGFNPVYGQGMTTAALGAQALGACLDEVSAPAGPYPASGLTHRFQKRLAELIATPWLMATGEDFRWPTTQGGRPDRISHWLHRYMDQVIQVAAQDQVVQKAFIEVTHLIRPPVTLFHAPVAARVLRSLFVSRPGRAISDITPVPGR